MTGSTTAGSPTRESTPPKPVPVPDELSAGYWEATADGRLAIQRCRSCGHLSHPPTPVCGACFAVPPAFDFAPVSGRGTIRTWTVFRQSFLPGFADDVPYTVVVVELDEQPDLTVIGRLVPDPDSDTAGLSLGAPVSVVLEPTESGHVVPAFRLEPGAHRSSTQQSNRAEANR